MKETRLFTIGHSNRTSDDFVSLLKEFGITAVADVRSSPFSGRNPQFNRDSLKQVLPNEGINYVFLGEELGARRSEPQCYEGDVAKYELIAQAPLFLKGLDRVRTGLSSYRIALMCAERDPLTCHRTILVCRHLKDEQAIEHIIDHGETESHADAESRLLKLAGLTEKDLFRSPAEILDEAYEMQGAKIAYRVTPVDEHVKAGGD